MKVCGAAFIVFNGSLKADPNINAKLSVIEDGIMLQIEIETMNKLKQTLKSMQSFEIETLKASTTESKDTLPANSIIKLVWIKENKQVNSGRLSIIDGSSLQGIRSLRLGTTIDYYSEAKSIKWIEIFLKRIEEDDNSENGGDSGEEMSNFNLNRFADLMTQAACTALIPVLEDLCILNMIYLFKNREKKNINSQENVNSRKRWHSASLFDPFKLGLRIEITKESVGYVLGMNGETVNEPKVLTSLDAEIIPMLHQQANSSNLNIELEFWFSVQDRFKI